MDVKPATSYDEQIEKLKARGCNIPDPIFAKSTLQQINYYRLTAYFLPYRIKDDKYKEGTCFNTVFQIHEFDRKLRHLIFTAVEEIELMLRTRLAYFHSHKYGPLGYTDAANFCDEHCHSKFEMKVDSHISHNRNQLFVKHHLRNFEGKFPLWVIIELFTMGDLSLFFSDMLLPDRKEFATAVFCTTEANLKSWLLCLTNLRNYCAHYARLYYTEMRSTPKTPKSFKRKFGKGLFDYLMVLNFLYPSKEKWKSVLVTPLTALIEEYLPFIELHRMKFPQDWEVMIGKEYTL